MEMKETYLEDRGKSTLHTSHSSIVHRRHSRCFLNIRWDLKNKLLPYSEQQVLPFRNNGLMAFSRGCSNCLQPALASCNGHLIVVYGIEKVAVRKIKLNEIRNASRTVP